jgi:hypothetical protein
MHLTVATAWFNFLTQVRQANIGSVTLNQILFSILSGASTFRAGQANNLAEVFVKLQMNLSFVETKDNYCDKPTQYGKN